MHILYLTPSFTGTENVILNKSDHFTGLPPFVKMIQGIRSRGFKIDFIIVDTKEKRGHYINNKGSVDYVVWNPKGIGVFKSIIKIISAVRKKIKENRYDFVYGHGSIGVIATIISRIYGVPTGQRLYGAYPLLKSFNEGKSNLKIFLNQPLYYLSFKLKKEFLVVTEDGTKGDLIYERINRRKKPKFNFYCWTNGVDELHYTEEMEDIDEKFIFYPGRISSQKQQLKVLELIEILKERKVDIKFYFAGANDGPYSEKVFKKVDNKSLKNNVVFLGPVDREKMSYLYKNSLATLLFYHMSNKGNTALEALKCGALIITYDNSGLNDLIVNGESGFLVNNYEEVAELIIELLNNKYDVTKLKLNSKKNADSKLEDWDERISKEINLIINAIDKNN